VKLELEKVACGYGGPPVVRDINIRAEGGEFVGIVGPNGSGKTTILRCISGVIPVERGRILVDGRALQEMDTMEIARNIAVVPQDHHIGFEFPVHDIVLMGRYPHIARFRFENKNDYKKTESVMKNTGVYSLRERAATELSGGEKQRVIIARALAQEPRILLMDEPTSHLDISHQLEVLDLVKNLVRDHGLMVVGVFHDFFMATRYCDRLIMLHKGRIISEGAVEDVLSEKNFADVFGVEARTRQNGDGRLYVDVVGRLEK
jgi:iron complex transport system ATP-binding protein